MDPSIGKARIGDKKIKIKIKIEYICYFTPMAGGRTTGEPKPLAMDTPRAADSLWQVAAAKSSHASIAAVFRQVMVRVWEWRMLLGLPEEPHNVCMVILVTHRVCVEVASQHLSPTNR